MEKVIDETKKEWNLQIICKEYPEIVGSYTKDKFEYIKGYSDRYMEKVISILGVRQITREEATSLVKECRDCYRAKTGIPNF